MDPTAKPDSAKADHTAAVQDTVLAFPMSFAQQRLWFLDELQPGNPIYNIAWGIRLRGPLNVATLERSLNEILRRHEVLRATFSSIDDAPVQIIAPELRVQLSPVDWPADGDNAEIALQRFIRVESERAMDLNVGPLFRAQLLRLADDHHVLVVNTHHIVFDRWSRSIFFRELTALYGAFSTGAPSPLPELPLQYPDYAVWQRDFLQGANLEKQLAYWKKQLGGAPAVLELPTDRPRPATQTFSGSSKRFQIPKAAMDELAVLSRREGVTLFMTLLAALETLLFRYTGQEDIVVGTPIANRNRAEIENLIGFFANTLALRLDLSGNPTFRELLVRAREVALGAYSHQDLPFEKLVEELRPERSLSHNPLFQVLFALQNAPAQELKLSGVTISAVPGAATSAKFDLALFLMETSDGLDGRLEYNTDLFDESTIDRWVEHFANLLQAAVSNPESRLSDLSILGPAEQQQLLSDWNSTAAEYPRNLCLHHLFENQALSTPDAVAVRFGHAALSYRELNESANRLARFLQKRGIGPKKLVGVFVERSLDMMVALLAVQKAGAAYVPMDPAYPSDRLGFMLEDAQPPVLLTQAPLLSALPPNTAEVICLDRDRESWDDEDPRNTESAASPEDLVYVIFTSGSTGRPKGVQVPHRGVVNLLTCMGRELHMGVSDVVVALASFAFDMCIPELYLPLITGGTVVIGTREIASDGEGLAKLLQEVGATLIHATPTTWSLLLQAGYTGAGRKRVVGAEPLPRELCTRLLQADASLYNYYGPTETTVWSTFQHFRSPDEVLTVGKPLANTQVYILDKFQHSVPIGVAGELYIGGDGVSEGYLNRPDLTAQKFVSNPFGTGKLYRTGDLARFLSDGRIEFAGRIDNQVKLRGFRIELEEIEAVLGSQPGVEKAVATVREDVPGDKRLVAYFVSAVGSSPNLAEFRNALKNKLPDYMVPSRFVAIDKVPLNANGKVDRRALPAPDATAPDREAVDTDAANPIEEIIAAIWAQILRIERVGVHDDFFELGGHSLLATQVISRMRAAFNLELPLRLIFEAPTVAAQAERIEQEKRSAQNTPTPALKVVPRSSELPLSFAQQRLWLLERLGSTGGAYNIPLALRITGKLDVTALEASVTTVVDRHEVLRAIFELRAGEPVQVIQPPAPVPIQVHDLSSLPVEARESRALQMAGEEARAPFDLDQGPLYRVSLLKLGSEDHVFLATVHHIAFDGWSIGIFLDEVTAAYSGLCAGTKNKLPDLPLQYIDYAAWQREYLQGDTLDRQLAYWKQTLAGAPASIDLPTDYPRPPMQTFRGGKETVLIPSDVSDKLKRLGRGEGVTLFMTLLAAFNVLLSRYAGQDDVVVGSPIAGRSRPELERIIGFFVNTLVLRTDLSGNPGFRELLGRVRESALGAYTHQDIPFEKLVEELRPERDLARNPIFQVMFVLHNEPNQKREIPGATLGTFNKDFGTALFDLTLVATETPEGIRTAFSYNADLFRPETIQRMAAQFQNIVQAVIGDPSITVADIPLLDEQETYEVVVGFNQTQMQTPPVCLPQLFEERVRRNPEAIALRCGDQALTYQELNRRANQLAHYLRNLGIGPETLVGLYVERSVEMVVALLGIMKAGAAYVPLDPAYPKDRIAFILEDSKAGLLITQQNLIGTISASGIRCVSLDADQQAIAAESVENPTPLARPENLAYVLYTSGSTGRPKGVQVEQRNLVNFLSAMQHEPGMTANDVLLAVTTLSFDIAGLELYLPLTTGAQIALASREEAIDAARLMRRMREWDVTVMQATPATWHMLLAAGWQGSPKLKLLCGGEALPPELAEQLVPRCGQLWNMYGPTETTIWSSLYRVRSNIKGVAPIGKPIGNTQMYVLDKSCRPVPLGVVGELYIGGDGVARGYLNRPELTDEKFIADPFRTAAGARLYRTGDLARYLPDGNLLFLGRGDTQVKLRGFRIELGEIEAVLVQHPAVKRAVVLVREDVPGDKRLACYVVPVAGRTVEPAELRSHLKVHVPEYMVPSAFMVLEALPLTPNGKVDRRALPRPEAQGARERIAPRNELETLVMQAWERVLGVQSIGVTDNFFELGGHSLLAVRLMADIEKTTGKLLPLATLFQGATVEYLAGLLRQESKPAHQIVLEVQKGSESKPAFFGVVTPGANALGYLALARHLGADQPVYRIQAPGPRPSSPYNAQDFERFAGQYIQAMKSVQPKGPYYIGGMCGGARIAFDMARLLEANGDQVALLAILDTWVIENSQNRLLWNCFYYGQRLRRFLALPLAQRWKLLRNTVPNILKRVFGSRRTQKTEWAMAYWPNKDFVPKKFGGKITVFKIPKQPFFYVRDPLMGWGTRTTGEVEVRLFSGVHSFILREPHVQSLAGELRATLKKLHRTKDGSEAPGQAAAVANSVGSSAPNVAERFWRNRRNGAGPFLDVAKQASGNKSDHAEEQSAYIDSAAERLR